MKFSLLIAAVLCICCIGCIEDEKSQPRSASGVSKASVKVPTGPDGKTTEQRNIAERLIADNEPGSIKHLYVISAYSGQVIIYSTVKGKVTSSSKRLTPNTVCSTEGQYVSSTHYGIPVNIGGKNLYTGEVLQDDGTYGHSIPYVFWWDTKGIYHQHYVSGGQILHVASEPVAVKGVIINMEMNVHTPLEGK